jgi:hypothetical protein
MRLLQIVTGSPFNNKISFLYFFLLFPVFKVWLKGGEKPFLTGDQISVADILAACELEQPSMAG